MRIVFRVDASLEIGTGHVMRCLTLADVLCARGATCLFVCRAHPGNLLNSIHQRGYETLSLPKIGEGAGVAQGTGGTQPRHAAWVGVDWTTDARQTLALMKDKFADWLIIDHYGLDWCWEGVLRPVSARIMVIDDLADRRHDCDVLLDQGLGRSALDYEGLVPSACKIFAGADHVLFRPEFHTLREESYARRKIPRLRNLLVTMGGVDAFNATTAVLEVLGDFPLPPECRITVVMGLNSIWLEQVRDRAENLPYATQVLVDVQNMAEVMAANDFAITAAGITALECCFLGLPTLAVVLADNQRRGAKALHDAGVVEALDVGDSIGEGLHAKLPHLLRSEKLEKMQRACSDFMRELDDRRGNTGLIDALL